MKRQLWLLALVSVVLLSATPAAAATLADGYLHSLGVRADGSMVAWGNNDYVQCNVPSTAQSGVIAVAGGYGRSLVLRRYPAISATIPSMSLERDAVEKLNKSKATRKEVLQGLQEILSQSIAAAMVCASANALNRPLD